MNLVPITRFHLPNGRQSQTSCEVSDKAFIAYQKAALLGLRVTAEMLTTGAVSLCLENSDLGDFDCRLAGNGPGPDDPPAVLERMLLAFDPVAYATWEKEMNADSNE